MTREHASSTETDKRKWEWQRLIISLKAREYSGRGSCNEDAIIRLVMDRKEEARGVALERGGSMS